MHSRMIYLPRQKVSLYARIMGRGYPVVLMHGGLGVDHSTLLPMAVCKDKFQLIFYDHRCNGRSIGPDISSLTWDNLTLDAEELRESLGIGKWAVLGHSFGGMIAQEYTLRFPQNVSHLILMDSGVDAALVQENAARVLAERGFSKGKVEAARRLFNGELRPKELPKTMLRIGKAYYYKQGPIMKTRALLNALMIRRRPEACIFGFQNLLQGWNIKDRLQEIRVPVLVIAGRDDFQFPPEHQQEVAEALPFAHCEIVEKASHNPLIERPKETIALIRRFIEA